MSRNQPPPTFVDERPMPARVSAERAILGAVLLDCEWYPKLAAEVEATDFYRPEHEALWRLFGVMAQAQIPIDLMTVTNEIIGSPERYGGFAYVAELGSDAVAAENHVQYARSVAAAAQRRAFYKASLELSLAAMEQQATVDELHAAWLAIGSQLQAGRRRQRVESLEDVYTALEERWEDEANEAVPPPLATGFAELDGLIDGGVRGGQLVVIAAQTAMGKSALATGFATTWAKLGRPVLYWSLEMPRRFDMAARSLAASTGSSVRAVHHGGAGDLRPAARALRSLLLCDRPRPTLEQVATEARRIWAGGGLSVLVVDHLGLMDHAIGRGERRDVAIGRVANGLKQLALELGITVILVCQFNRQIDRREVPADPGERWYEQVPLPQLSDLRESGEIEQAADLVLFPIHAARYGLTGLFEDYGAIVVAKNRNGPCWIVPCRWDAKATRYLPMEAL